MANEWMNNGVHVLYLMQLTVWSKSKTFSSVRGHSRPHLHVPSLSMYAFSSGTDLSCTPLGLEIQFISDNGPDQKHLITNQIFLLVVA